MSESAAEKKPLSLVTEQDPATLSEQEKANLIIRHKYRLNDVSMRRYEAYAEILRLRQSLLRNEQEFEDLSQEVKDLKTTILALGGELPQSAINYDGHIRANPLD